MSQLAFRTVLNSRDDIDTLLNEADEMLINGRRHSAIIGQAHMVILQKFRRLTFRDLELRYRALESETYLIAMPKRKLPAGLQIISAQTGKPLPFWVWVEVNGEDAAANHRIENDLGSVANNLANLARTGFLSQTG